jgi:hypothetical protein
MKGFEHPAYMKKRIHTEFWWENPILLGRLRHRRNDNINTDDTEIG